MAAWAIASVFAAVGLALITVCDSSVEYTAGMEPVRGRGSGWRSCSRAWDAILGWVWGWYGVLLPPPLVPVSLALAHQTIVILGGFAPGICSVTIWAWLSFAGISGVALSSVCFCGWTMLRFSSRNKVRERERDWRCNLRWERMRGGTWALHLRGVVVNESVAG